MCCRLPEPGDSEARHKAHATHAFADCLEELLSDRGRLAAMGDCGRRHAVTRDWSSAAETAAAYKRLARKRRELAGADVTEGVAASR